MKSATPDNPRIAFLHTAAVHAPTFAGLMARLAPEISAHHLEDATLLADAMAAGAVTEEIARRLSARLDEAAGSGANLIVCTCSTLGGAAEEQGRAAGLRVLRIDRAMAEQAVARGRRIVVAACLESTVRPTTELLREVAAARGAEPELRMLVIKGAWARFEAGDLEGYHATIADALRAAAGEADVVVLAQASMAPAAERCADLATPILSSPELGLRHALALLGVGAPD